MISQRDKAGDLARFYTVTDPRRHQKGFTIYKVTARTVSRKNPDDVQEIVTWKRYSDFKKLHRDLWQIHKNLFRQTELFPPFAKAKLFGRFDECVIEERRQCAEDLLQFSANIPALYNSPQLEDFFRGGEVHDGSDLIGPAEPFGDFPDSLSDCSSEVRKDSCGLDDVTFTSQSECGGLSSDSDLISLTVDIDSLSWTDDGMASDQISPSKPLSVPPSPGAVAQNFPGSSYEGVKTEAEKESRSLFAAKLKQKLGKSDYLTRAGELITLAMKKETEQDYEAAFGFYRKGVDLLLEGVQGEASPTRREAVKKKTAEYLMRAETISSLCLNRSSEASMPRDPPGAESSRPSSNLRSPAEELKAFRVLGVIDKVLLVLDTKTQETFILKGLRKSSEESGSRKTIVPRCVPNMVCLHKYIISEESVFLVLQHAEGGKLWSYLSKFLSGSAEGSFDVPLAKSSHSNEDLLKNLAPCPRNSVESRASSTGNRLSVQPLQSSLTLSSQDDSSTQDEEGRESPLKWADSASSSEEECTTSYLTLCKEYGQEQIEPGTLSDEPLLKLGDGDSTKDLDLMQKALSGPFNKFGSELNFDAFKLLNEHGEQEMSGNSGMSDALNKSRNSPMEFFRIDSKESTSDLLGTDFVDKGYNLKPENCKTFSPFQDDEVDPDAQSLDDVKPSMSTHDTMSRGSNDSVPVISFKEAALDDVSSIDEGRPDLLVNLPGAQLVDTEQSSKNVYIENDVMDSKLLETPDVLQIKSSIDKLIELENNLLAVGDHSTECESRNITLCPISVDLQSTSLSGSDILCSLKPLDPRLNNSPSSSISHNSSILEASQLQQDSCAAQQSSDSEFRKELSTNLMQLQIRIEDTDESCAGQRDLREDSEIHKIFQELDAKLSEASCFFIPESCIRRWAAEIVVALDALHQEGIVCRDLNPNNILLNDRGHIQLTYFSRWTEVEDSCDSDAVERMYCAPEIGGISEEMEACDWWSLGALLFELLTRKALVDCHPAGISTHTSIHMPEFVSKEARSLVQQLLQFNPLERLGAGVAGVEDIKSHPFFNGVDWGEFTR
ncbi:LOW QUALITY PROTEIN: ribosomal protein S6 kinase delta-1 [Bufo gargarizans]|uniref:LOW QUALITY PROTEIN: ribosomal protein S6 kinase delta-1 n=1 Tax=Bufo gargarizans TaxID=30331 RepID=UPI001CF5A6EB|nr:LOW QUALITY PROTEIN: ribosomal protein S6 kinase delta-1 [Bufo gargarizans]